MPTPLFAAHPFAEYPFADVPLVVAYAAANGLAAARPGALVPLASAPEVPPEDGYLVLPARAMGELEAAFAQGQTGRLRAWFDEALVIEGELERGRAGARLRVGGCWNAREAIDGARPKSVALSGVGEPVRVLNRLAGMARLCPAGLFDRVAVEAFVHGRDRAGFASNDPEALATAYAWASARAGGGVLVRVALVDEDGEASALLAPASLLP